MSRPKFLHYYLIANKKNKAYENLPSLNLLKKDYIRYILKITNNNLKETADILKVPPHSLHHQLNK